MPASLLLHRFEEFGELTPREVSVVMNLARPPRALKAGGIIRYENDPVTSFYLLLDGWAISSMMTPNGSRQILKVHLPGDALGTPSMSCDTAIECLQALTPVSIGEVPFEHFGSMLEEHPRLGARFLLSVQRERASLMDQLVSMGRTSAEAGLAAFLLDLVDRLTPLGLVKDDSFELRLTQEQIGDVLGLTSVHVNRMLRSLENQGLFLRDRQTMTIKNRAALLRLAARRKRAMPANLEWLPASR